ncbi:hypothetical protein CSC27_2664 [Pseudomonas aeruginosa]|nr:hypothetical protein CSC27_2664 [Pseudomonas aeruginosa]
MIQGVSYFLTLTLLKTLSQLAQTLLHDLQKKLDEPSLKNLRY